MLNHALQLKQTDVRGCTHPSPPLFSQASQSCNGGPCQLWTSACSVVPQADTYAFSSHRQTVWCWSPIAMSAVQAHAETAEVRGKVSEQELLVTELRCTTATVASAAEKVPELRAQPASQQQPGKTQLPCNSSFAYWSAPCASYKVLISI